MEIVHETRRSTSIQTLRWNHDGNFLAIGDREVAILASGSFFEVKCEISNTAHHELSGNTNKYRVGSLCWSPDGRFLAVGGASCLVIETKGYTLVHEVRRSGNIECLAWGQQLMPNGDYRRYLGIGDESRIVALLKAGAEIEGSVADSDDLSSAASSSYFSTDWILREDTFRDVEDPIPDAPHAGLKPQVTSVAFSRASKTKTSSYLAFAADDCSLTILATKDWRAVFQMEFAKPIRTLAFSNRNDYLALGGDEGVLYVLSVPSRSMILNTIFSSPIQSLGFSKLDERLSVGSKDGLLTLLSPESNWEPVGEIELSESRVLAQDWSFKHLAVGREDGSVAVFENEKVYSHFFVSQAELSQKQAVRSVAFDAAGRFLAVGGDTEMISVYSLQGGWVICHQMNVSSSVLTTSWSPAGRYFAYAGKNKTMGVVDTISWAEVDEVRDGASSKLNANSNASISSVAWSFDGKWVCFGSAAGGIHLLSTRDWQVLVPSASLPSNNCTGTEPARAALDYSF